MDRMVNVDWRKEVTAGLLPITQAIGQAACQVEIEALIVPSAAKSDGFNVLVFPANLKKGSKIEVLNADFLGSV